MKKLRSRNANMNCKRIGSHSLRVFLVLLLFISIGTGVWADNDSPERELLLTLERLDVSEDELSSITETQEKYSASRRIPQAEIEVLRAQISRELLADQPDLRDVENLIRESLEYELEIRMAQIIRELEMQEILGPRRWALMKQLSRQFRQSGINLRTLSQRIRNARPDLIFAMRVIEMYGE